MPEIDLAEAIAALVAQADDPTLDEFGSRLTADGEFVPDHYRDLVRQGRIAALHIVSLARAIKNDERFSPLLPTIFQTARTTKILANANRPSVELAWTGPWPDGGRPLRASFNIYREMLDSASHSIFATMYSISGASHPQELIHSMASARNRGCRVTLLLNHNEDNLRSLRKLWPPTVSRPRILSWSNAEDTGYIHAKLLLVDGRDLFITSANMSLHGMALNIETGIRVSGPPAVEMAMHLDALERSGLIAQI